MLKIGDFSKICQLSIRTLRHWDTISLLTPAQVDAETSYRYYGIEQLNQVNRILALRAMGLSLPQVKQLLSENLSAAEIRGMLRLKQAEIQEQMENGAVMLQAIESRLNQIDGAGKLPPYEAVLKSTPSQQIYAVREYAAHVDHLVDALREIYPYARRQEGTNLMAVFYDEAYDEEQIDVEIGFPADSLKMAAIPLASGRTLKPVELPSIDLMATTIHSGLWLNLPQGYGYLGNWIETNGYEIAGPGREIFHFIDWENNQQATVTELQFPVKKR